MRTIFNFAGPIEVDGIRFSDKTDRKDLQTDYFVDLLLKPFSDNLKLG